MNVRLYFLVVVFFALGLGPAFSSVLYVDVNCTNPTPPYADWSTAATDIQSAVDAASDGDFIWVNDGVYQSGARVVYGSLTNRVVLNKAVTVQSVNGPAATSIVGNPPFGSTGIRCVYLTNNATLSGFTLTNGGTRFQGSLIQEQSGGGAWCEGTNAWLTNCFFTGNRASQQGGAVFNGSLLNCILTNNRATFGGGAGSNWAGNCLIIANFGAGSGGAGAYGCTLYNCTLSGNSDPNTGATGGGARSSQLFNCMISNNLAYDGGGVSSSTLSNCMVLNNSAIVFGGGAYQSTLVNGTVAGNAAMNDTGVAIPYGGGGETCTFSNCTLTGNVVSNGLGGGHFIIQYGAGGGGADNSTLYSCSVIGNLATCNVAPSTCTGGGLNNSTAYGCLIISNSVSTGQGGGVQNSRLNNCLVNNNSAGSGGGAASSSLTNCLLTGNTATNFGGGAYLGVLINCTVVSNSQSAPQFGDTFRGGGGAAGSMARNCIIYFNSSATNESPFPSYPNYFYSPEFSSPVPLLTNCCSWPLTNGVTVTNDPQFVNISGGDFHLLSASRCINAGTNIYIITNGVDLDGNPRVSGGAVDIGAYEFQGQVTGTFAAWLAKYLLPTNGAADLADSDGDGMNNLQEWLAGTNPTNAQSSFLLYPPMKNGGSLHLSWQGVTNRIYCLQRSTDLIAQPFVTIQSNFVGAPFIFPDGTQRNITADLSATNAGPYYYRVMLQ
ncbi:MAG TPA: thrombospondin type 3 repeat-containing protein [Candidatus Acidoferrales bacterium]|jgi:hypothetical protein|nr:thrombospondin type 3 repeat-containing protein [Candidatus Acidoferrales bacterium]